ncbi:hypothetical protein ACIA98_42230 [Streptomyces sp. NPDC051366]|uniref:hypothetical protein n=1 Tax=Streptomyces sp. NPDC051366 TaxID=3365652 RepID=UPI0037B6B5A3
MVFVSDLHRAVETAQILRDLATGWHGRRVLVIARSAGKWARDCLSTATSIEDPVDAPFGWREGRHYTLPTDWPHGRRGSRPLRHAAAD